MGKRAQPNEPNDYTVEAISKRRKALRRGKFLKELAEQVYSKYGDIKPPSEEVQYSGRIKDFSIVPDELTFSGKHLSSGEKICWLVLFAHCRTAPPGYRVSWLGRDSLALIIGKRERAVSKYLEELTDKGLLRSKRRLGKPTLRLLLDPPSDWMNETKDKLSELKKKGHHG